MLEAQVQEIVMHLVHTLGAIVLVGLAATAFLTYLTTRG